MTFRVARATPKSIEVEMACGRWVVDRTVVHPRFMVVAHSPDGRQRCTIGMHRIKDGSQMNPEYAKFLGLLRRKA